MRMTDSISIIDTGVANLRSLTAAFERLGFGWRLTTSGSDVTAAKHVVLPGVGSFAAAAGRLDELQLRQSLRSRIESGRSTLCICLGMQLLCAESEESPNVRGLAIVNSKIEKFSSGTQVPQLGWNLVLPAASSTGFDAGEAYFANSFRLGSPPAGWGYATTEYGDSFVSAIWKERVLACQFHPELSGPWGQRLLENWLNRA